MTSIQYTPTEAQDLEIRDHIVFFEYDKEKPFEIISIYKSPEGLVTFIAREKHDLPIETGSKIKEFIQISRTIIQLTCSNTTKLMKYEELYSNDDITFSTK